MKRRFLKVVSVLCTFLELVAFIILGVGIATAFSGEVFLGVMMILGGIVGILCLQVLAGWVEVSAGTPSVRRIKKAIKEKDLTEALKKDAGAASEVFQVNPSFRLYFYIRKLNPDAAKMIRQSLAVKRKSKISHKTDTEK